MKKKPINPFLVGAIVLGLLCIVLIIKHNNQKEAEHQQQMLALEEQKKKELEAAEARAKELASRPTAEMPKPKTKPLVYIKAPLQARTEINEAMVELRETLLESIPQGAYEKIEDVKGKFALRNLDALEIATHSKIKSRSEIGTMSFRIATGMRAISIKVSPDSSAGNLINDGDYVDLMLTEMDKENKPARTRIVLQNIKVLSFYASTVESDQSQGLAKTAPETVTIEVTPEQAEGLTQITHMGTLSMILRSVKDRGTIRTQGFAREEIQDDMGVIQGRAQRTLRSVLKTQEIEKAAESSTLPQEVKNGQ